MVEELAKLRRKFKKMDQLHAYDRKKYIFKLLYVFMLGYECDVGHAEAVSLISQPKYAEKQVGYMVTSVILNESFMNGSLIKPFHPVVVRGFSK